MNISICKILKNYNYFINKDIKIFGWVKNIRFTNINLIFIELNDGSCIKNLQIIIKNNISYYKKKINIGYSLYIIGKIIISKGNIKKQNIELLCNYIKILGKIYNQKLFPISSSKYNKINFIRKFFHLRSKSKIFSSISRIRNFVYKEINNILNNNGFIWVQTPIITSIDTENIGNLFKVSSLNIYNDNKNIEKNDFFKKKAFLTVSGQLNLESYVLSMSKVYSFGPIFRAENSNTRKHLSEFWMLEVEIALKNIDYIISFILKFIKKIYIRLINNLEDDMFYINGLNNNDNIKNINKNLNDNNIKIINYKDAIDILKKKFNTNFGDNITTKYENYLLKYFNSLIVIKNFPKNIKPFYMKLNNDNITVSSFDILFPGVGEIVGGSEREYRYNILFKSMKKNKINLNLYKWYLDLRKYGTLMHSGFGIGFERLIMYFTGIKNIKDIIPFPRYPNNLYM